MKWNIKARYIFLGLAGLFAMVVIAFPVFNSVSPDHATNRIRSSAIDIGIALHSYKKDHGRFPDRLDDVRELVGSDEPFQYPNLTDLSMNSWEVPKDAWTLTWIYIPPGQDQDIEVPLLIAPLPHLFSKEKREYRRLVLWPDHRVDSISELKMPAIWAAIATRLKPEHRNP